MYKEFLELHNIMSTMHNKGLTVNNIVFGLLAVCENNE